jgi:peroxiredoxin
MKRGIGLLSVVIALIVVSGVLSACSSSSAANVQNPSIASAPVTPSSVFKVSSLAINPPEVNAGVQILMVARVTNTSGGSRNYRANVRIDNTANDSLPAFLPSAEVQIPAGATQPVSVVATVNNPGKYKVTWDNVSESLIVNPEDTSVSANGSNTISAAAPDFSAVDVVTGKKISLSEFLGSVVLLNFVNYGCDPSTSQIVSAQLLAIKQLQSQRFDFVPVSVFCGCCSPEVLRQFASQNGFNWPWILDSDYSIAAKYASSLRRFGYPTLIFINKDHLISEVAGYTDLAVLNDKIDKIIAAQGKS